MISRRAVLASVATVAGGAVIGTLPRAHAAGSLDATVEVLADAADETGDVGHLWIRVTNERPARGEAIEPVVQCWAMERQTQISWDISPAGPLAPGDSRVIFASAPGERATVRLPQGNRGLVRLWDPDVAASAHDTWVVGDP